MTAAYQMRYNTFKGSMAANGCAMQGSRRSETRKGSMASAQKTASLLPVYLAVGEDALKRKAVYARLLSRFEKEGDISFDHDTFQAGAAAGEDIAMACNTLPFLSAIRLVEVRSVENISKADSEALIAYLSDPNPTTVLYIEGEKLAKNTRLYKAIASVSKQAIIDCSNPKSRDFPSHVRALAVSHGVTIGAKAAALLVEMVGEDTVALDAQLQKLALSRVGKSAVSEEEVRRFVAQTSEVKPWKFVDAFSARDVSACVRYLANMPSVSPFALLTMCTKRLRELMCASSLDKRGRASDLPSVLGLPDWRCKNHIRWARAFGDDRLREGLRSARDLEQRMKSGADPKDAFLEWVLHLL